MSDIHFAKCDVTVQEYELGDCSNCGGPLRHPAFYVSLDFRGAGTTCSFAEEIYCSAKCAEEIAERIRETLPDVDE